MNGFMREEIKRRESESRHGGITPRGLSGNTYRRKAQFACETTRVHQVLDDHDVVEHPHQNRFRQKLFFMIRT